MKTVRVVSVKVIGYLRLQEATENLKDSGSFQAERLRLEKHHSRP